MSNPTIQVQTPTVSPAIRITCDRFFERQGHKMHYLDAGKGDPVVMVHGNPSWSIYYRRLVETLQNDYRCIVPDHIGCGFSDKPDDSEYAYTLKSRIDDLEALLLNLGIDKNITLVVHDWGGAIGMGFAARHPEAIKRLVFLNTAAFPLPDSKKDIPAILRFCRDSRLGATLVDRFNAFSVGASLLGCTWHPMAKNLREAYQLPYTPKSNRRATLRFIQDIPLGPEDAAWEPLIQVKESLPQFKQLPTLICWGMKDFVFDADFLAEFERYFPQAEVHRFEQAGHYVLEDAGEQVLPLVRSFLAKHPL